MSRYLSQYIHLIAVNLFRMVCELDRGMFNFCEMVGMMRANPDALWNYPILLMEAERLLNFMLITKDVLTISYSRYTDQEIITIGDAMISAKQSEADVAELQLWLKLGVESGAVSHGWW